MGLEEDRLFIAMVVLAGLATVALSNSPDHAPLPGELSR
jgi:hypothetical protein